MRTARMKLDKETDEGKKRGVTTERVQTGHERKKSPDRLNILIKIQ